ncbi:MAG: SCO family protein [bacterium]
MRFSVLIYWLLLCSLATNDAWSLDAPVQDRGAAETLRAAFDYDSALRASQQAIDNQVRDLEFVNASGASMRFSEFRGKPLVLSMIYTSCYQVCPMTTQYLAKVIEKARDALGPESFAVALVGFEPRFDTPDAMRFFAEKQNISNHGWNLLSIDQADLESLTEDIGFVYYPSSNGFDHIIQTTIIDPDGTVYRQVYGQVFETPLLVDPLIDLVLGRPQPAESLLSEFGKKVRLFCTTYDPVRDGYYFDYSLFLGMLIGAIIIAYTGFVMIRETRAR